MNACHDLWRLASDGQEDGLPTYGHFSAKSSGWRRVLKKVIPDQVGFQIEFYRHMVWQLLMCSEQNQK